MLTTGKKIEAVVIGASAGAVDALSRILPSLPAGFTLPVIIVVHIPSDKNSLLATLFQRKCHLDVKEAEDKEPIQKGRVYFAPPGYHLLVEPGCHLSLSGDVPVQYSRPSIDVLFESAADAYGAALLGIVLTGANSDGANGLRAIGNAGGTMLVQDPDSALMPVMPQAALAACPDAAVWNLEQIASFLREVG